MKLDEAALDRRSPAVAEGKSGREILSHISRATTPEQEADCHYLLHSHALRQIAWLIDIRALENGGMVGQ
jgi:hypothetical protein